MSIPTSTAYPLSRDGKPINIGDTATILGTVTAVNGTGSTAVLTVTLLGSGVIVSTVQAQDVGASTQTL
jgi:hypothetical protein